MRQPPPEKARDGRINPMGLPCLYAALDPNTAVAEVRPWRLALLTVATFTTPRSIDVVDLRQASGGQKRPAAYWAAHMIQRPVHEKDPLAYLGTQYLAERLKAAGAGGLLYDSALGPYDQTKGTRGTNVALFSSDDLQDGKTVPWVVLDVKYTAAPRPD
jgi:RES domain-containing protein